MHRAASSLGSNEHTAHLLNQQSYNPLRPIDTARAMSAATCVRDWRKLSASRVMRVMLTAGALDWPYPAASRRDSTRSPRCRIAGTSSGRSPAQPPECMRGAPAKASAGTIRPGPGDPTMPPACRMLANSPPAPPSAPDNNPASGPKMNRRAASLARSAIIDVTRSRKSSLPVLTNVATRF